MPSKSLKQHNFMLAACIDKEFADEVDIKQQTACEIVKKDKKAGKWQKKKKKKVSKEAFHISSQW